MVTKTSIENYFAAMKSAQFRRTDGCEIRGRFGNAIELYASGETLMDALCEYVDRIGAYETFAFQLGRFLTVM